MGAGSAACEQAAWAMLVNAVDAAQFGLKAFSRRGRRAAGNQPACIRAIRLAAKLLICAGNCPPCIRVIGYCRAAA